VIYCAMDHIFIQTDQSINQLTAVYTMGNYLSNMVQTDSQLWVIFTNKND